MISKETPQAKNPIWQRIFLENQSARSHHTSILFDHFIITIGGSFNDEDDEENEENEKTEQIDVFNIESYNREEILITGAKFDPRCGHTACLFNKKQILVSGGAFDRQLEKDEFLVITIVQKNNQRMSLNIEKIDIQDVALLRYFHTAEVFEDKMYVFGGAHTDKKISNELWSLDLKEYKWTKCLHKGHIPSPRLRHRSVLVGNKMYIFGGRNNLEPVIRMNDLFCLDLDTLVWNEVKCTGTIPSARNGMSMVEHKGLLYVFGGSSTDDDFSNELFSLNLKDKKWKLIEAKNKYPEPRGSHTMVSCENGIFLYSGATEVDYFADLFYLNLVSLRKEKRLHGLEGQLGQLYLNALYSDIIFLVQGEQIFAHKMLLGTRCKYFSNMFSSGMIESNQKEIEILDCKATTFKVR